MKNKRNRRNTRRARISPVAAVRGAIARHLRRYLLLYVPAAMPLLIFVLAHAIWVVIVMLIRSGALPQSLAVHKDLEIWAVFGFLPLLFCSYGCFFAVARPAARLLEHRFSGWMPGMLATGAAYGAAVALVLLLLAPGSLLRVFLVLLIGMTTGLGNWSLYRMATGASAQAVEPSRAEP
ncbi:MAG: hypothetical protein FWC49_04200 [Proteobacteria bacterium]|nr:hypothetical protein [Pseudomonadota bacterium]